MGQTTITRYRNSSTDVRLYHFEYIDGPWEQNSKLRQIVVQATDDKGRAIQVAILIDDLKRAAIEIIKSMFQRWLQENEFKYLDKYFGINQITSYRSIEYEQLRGQVEDREVKSADRKALDQKLKQVTEPSVSAGKKVEVPTGATIGDGIEDERGGLKPPAQAAPGPAAGWGARRRPPLKNRSN